MIGYTNDKEQGFLAPNLTALIDILFLLIVFFILSINPHYKIMDLNLPDVASNDKKSINLNKKTILKIGQKNFLLNNKKIKGFNQLREVLIKEVVANTTIILALDKATESEKFLKVINLLKENKFNNLSIVIDNPQK